MKPFRSSGARARAAAFAPASIACVAAMLGAGGTPSPAEPAFMALDVRVPARRKVIDKVAASVLLQAWLDHRRTTAEDPA